jgi:hypothetical protein
MLVTTWLAKLDHNGVAAAMTLLLLGWACGSGGGDVLAAVTRVLELGGGSLAAQLGQAGPPPITPGFGIAELVPEDGTRHFSLVVATENRTAQSDSAALYALMDAHDGAGQAWGANILAFAHSDLRGGAVQGLEIDVGNLGTAGEVPVTGLNLFAIGPKPSSVAVGILNENVAGPGGFREGIAFRSNPPGVAVTDALVRVHPGFGDVDTGIDLREARFRALALATPGFAVDGAGAVTSTPLATGHVAFACVDPEGRLFASAVPCPVGP